MDNAVNKVHVTILFVAVTAVMHFFLPPISRFIFLALPDSMRANESVLDFYHLIYRSDWADFVPSAFLITGIIWIGRAVASERRARRIQAGHE